MIKTGVSTKKLIILQSSCTCGTQLKNNGDSGGRITIGQAVSSTGKTCFLRQK